MKKKYIAIGVLIFIALNIVLIYLISNPTLLIPLINTRGRDQVYYVNDKPYPLGSYYIGPNQRYLILVGKLTNGYIKDNVAYANIQLTKSSRDTITAQIGLPNTQVSIIDQPIDYLYLTFIQSHKQNLRNPQQILYTLMKYKNQNLAFFAPLPASIQRPTNPDKKTIAYMERPDIAALGKLQDEAVVCNQKLLTNLEKKITTLPCASYFAEIHINTGGWKPI